MACRGTWTSGPQFAFSRENWFIRPGGDLRKWLKTSLTAFGLIFALTMITTLPTSPAEVLPSVVVSAAVAVLILIAGSVHGYYTDRKHGDAGKS